MKKEIKTTEQIITELTDKLLKSERLTETETADMFIAYNRLFPNRPENSPGCGSCRMRVKKRLLEYLNQELNIKIFNKEIKEESIDFHIKQYSKSAKIKLNSNHKLVIKEENKNTVKAIQRLTSHLIFDATKIKEEDYIYFYNAGFNEMFDVIDITNEPIFLNEEEIKEANIEMLEINEQITEKQSVTKRKYNKKK